MDADRPADLGARLYLDLLKRVLTRYAFGEQWVPVAPWKGTFRATLYSPIQRFLGSLGLQLVRRYPFDPEARAEGRDWPPDGETMIGLRRLDNWKHASLVWFGTGFRGTSLKRESGGAGR